MFAGTWLFAVGTVRTRLMARLQGLPSAVADKLMKVTVPRRAFEEAVGDGVSVTAVRRCLDAAELTALGEGRDWWLRCPRHQCFQLADDLLNTVPMKPGRT